MRHFLFFCAILLCTAASAQDANRLRQYEQLYLEAVCQREAGNSVAQYHLLQRAIEVNPEGAEAYYDLAMLQWSKSFPSDLAFMSSIARAYELRPDNKDYALTFVKMSQSYDWGGEHDDSTELNILKGLLNDPDKRDEAFAMLCGYYDALGDFDNLCKVLEQWRPIKADDEFITQNKMRMAMERGLLDEALLMADTLIDMPHVDRVNYLCVKGEILLGLHREQETLDIYNSLSQEERLEAGAQILLYKYAIQTDNDYLVDRVLKEIIVNPEMSMTTRTAALRSYLGNADGEKRSAKRDTLLSLLLPLPEEDPTLLATMLSQLQNEGEDSLCIPLFNKLLEINPADEYSRLNLMQEAINRQDYAEVERLCTDGLKENARQPLFYYFGGAALMIEEKEEEALTMLERGLAYITPETRTGLVSSYYSSYADALHKLGRKQEAYAMYDSALVYDNGNVMCLNNYAYFLSLDNERLDKAEQMSAYTIEVSPDEPTYLDTYAWIMFLQGDYEKAREYIDKALANLEDRNDASNVSLFDHAGDIYFHLGLRSEALSHWSHALSLDPKSQIIRKKVKERKYYKE